MRILDEDDEKSLEQDIQAVKDDIYTKNEVNNYVTGRLNNYYTVQQINEKIGDIETLLAAI